MNLFDTTTAARPRRPARPARRLAAAAVAVLALAGACSSDGDNGAPTTTESTTTTSTTTPGPMSDQTRPQSAFGMVHDGSKLWIADFYGGQVLAVDPDSGAILIRYKGDDGVSDEIDDLAIGPDGSVYWTGFNDGAVGRMTPSNVVGIVAGLDPGINGIAFSADGRLFVGRAVIGQGLWEIDPTQPEKPPRLISDSLGNINSFAVGPDDMIYGPRWGTDGGGELVRINPDTAELEVITDGFDGPIAVKLDAAGTTAYVLSLPPGGAPTVSTVDLATGADHPVRHGAAAAGRQPGRGPRRPGVRHRLQRARDRDHRPRRHLQAHRHRPRRSGRGRRRPRRRRARPARFLNPSGQSTRWPIVRRSTR